jgi:hypothetical protein
MNPSTPTLSRLILGSALRAVIFASLSACFATGVTLAQTKRVCNQWQ